MSLKPYNSRSNAGMQLYFDDYITRDQWRAFNRARGIQLAAFPATNIFETSHHLTIELVAPGVDPGALQIEVSEKGLLLRYDPGMPQFRPVNERRVLRNEFNAVAFQRNFELNPQSLEMDRLEVRAENGIIRFTIPKHAGFQGRLSTPNYFSMN